MMDQDSIDLVFSVQAALRRCQEHSLEALGYAEEAKFFTAQFIDELLSLNMSVDRLRARITDSSAIVFGINRVEVTDVTDVTP